MKAKILFINAMAMILSMSSCKKEAGPAGSTGATGAQGSQGPSGPVLTGNLKGYVNHFDVSGTKLTSGLAGDTLTIDGTTTMTVTDATGAYTFSNLTTGVYNLTVTRTGYGTTKIQSLQFTGGGDLYRNANISKMPTNNVTTFMAYDTTINSVNHIRVRGTLPSSTDDQTIMIFVGNPGSSTVSSAIANEISTYAININAGLPITAGTVKYSKNIPTSELYDLGYVSGNTVYLAAYTIGGNTNASAYVDLPTNKPIYTALGGAPLFANAPVQ
jgi:hypothetical protein